MTKPKVLPKIKLENIGQTFINWHKIPYVIVSPKDEDHIITIPYRYKAKIKEKEILFKKNIITPNDYLLQFNFAPLDKKDEMTLINLEKIIYIDINEIYETNKYIQLHIVLEDSFEIFRTLDSKRWHWWKTTFLTGQF
jgi:hypothetical protein